MVKSDFYIIECFLVVISTTGDKDNGKNYECHNLFVGSKILEFTDYTNYAFFLEEAIITTKIIITNYQDQHILWRFLVRPTKTGWFLRYKLLLWFYLKTSSSLWNWISLFLSRTVLSCVDYFISWLLLFFDIPTNKVDIQDLFWDQVSK